MAAIEIRWSLSAEADLFEILEFYYQRNGNIEYNLKINDDIKSHIHLLKQNPFLGRPAKHKNVGALIAGNYEILYEYINKVILIIMIWDCRRNLDDKVVHR